MLKIKKTITKNKIKTQKHQKKNTRQKTKNRALSMESQWFRTAPLEICFLVLEFMTDSGVISEFVEDNLFKNSPKLEIDIETAHKELQAYNIIDRMTRLANESERRLNTLFDVLENRSKEINASERNKKELKNMFEKVTKTDTNTNINNNNNDNQNKDNANDNSELLLL